MLTADLPDARTYPVPGGAAWLDGARSPFTNRIANSLAQLSLLCLPVYTALCLYSLGLRVQQYGLSVDRIHAAFMAIEDIVGRHFELDDFHPLAGGWW